MNKTFYITTQDANKSLQLYSLYKANKLHYKNIMLTIYLQYSWNSFLCYLKQCKLILFVINLQSYNNFIIIV